MSALKALKDGLVGILIGVVSHLPGASGSTIAVVFRVYERLVEDLADIKNKLLKDLIFIIPIGLGIVVGTVLCAKALDPFIDKHKIALYFMFLALIICQIPDIASMGNDGKPITKHNTIAFILGFIIMMIIMAIGLKTGEQTEPKWYLMVLAGIIFALAALSPGISSSTLLLALGIYTMYNDALVDLNMKMLIPFGIGAIIGVLAFSKLIDYAMKNHRKSTYAIILGLTFGSIVTILVDSIKLMTETTVDLELWGEIGIAVVIGLALGILLQKLAHIYSTEGE